MHNEELKNKLILFFDIIDKFIGKTIKIKQAISTNKDNFNRHFTTFVNFYFVLTHFLIRTSGAKMMFMGEVFKYEIDFDLIITFEEKENNEYLFIEKLSDNVYKRTVLNFF